MCHRWISAQCEGLCWVSADIYGCSENFLYLPVLSVCHCGNSIDRDVTRADNKGCCLAGLVAAYFLFSITDSFHLYLSQKKELDMPVYIM